MASLLPRGGAVALVGGVPGNVNSGILGIADAVPFGRLLVGASEP
jgi:hypothetical protein